MRLAFPKISASALKFSAGAIHHGPGPSITAIASRDETRLNQGRGFGGGRCTRAAYRVGWARILDSARRPRYV